MQRRLQCVELKIMEREIVEGMAYELYGLTEDEIKIVEWKQGKF